MKVCELSPAELKSLGRWHNSIGGRYARADTPNRTHPEMDLWICRRILAGMRPSAIVAATDGAIHLRTAYRWRKVLKALRVVELDGHRATFAIRHDGPPTRITAWEPVPVRKRGRGRPPIVRAAA